MGCVHPVKAFRTGYKTDTGAEELLRCPGCTLDVYSVEMAQRRAKLDLTNAPYTLINGVPFLCDPVYQPCGKCVGCRMADAREWKIRNCLEMTYEKYVYFVTLTYDDEHLLPLQKELYVKSIQDFFKRWRFNVGPLRYFCVFEFGEITLRPHFHLLFYSEISDLKPFGRNMFLSETLSKTWQNGQVLIEMVSPGNISYCCGYMEKKQKDPNWSKYAFKPFRLASKRPAIGFRYLEDHRHLFGLDAHVYGSFSESVGHNHAPIPTSFKRKLKEEDYFTRLQIASQLAGENAFEVSKVVYGLSNVPYLEDVQEQQLLAKVEKLRKATL